MIPPETTLGIRIVLVMQMMLLTISLDRLEPLVQHIRRIVRTLGSPLLPSASAKPKKNTSFFEIDMTRFEP